MKNIFVLLLLCLWLRVSAQKTDCFDIGIGPQGIRNTAAWNYKSISLPDSNLSAHAMILPHLGFCRVKKNKSWSYGFGLQINGYGNRSVLRYLSNPLNPSTGVPYFSSPETLTVVKSDVFWTASLNISIGYTLNKFQFMLGMIGAHAFLYQQQEERFTGDWSYYRYFNLRGSPPALTYNTRWRPIVWGLETSVAYPVFGLGKWQALLQLKGNMPVTSLLVKNTREIPLNVWGITIGLRFMKKYAE